MHLTDAIEKREELETIIQQLTVREKDLNNKMQNALKASIEMNKFILQVLEKKGNSDSIGIKRMGVLNHEPWRIACVDKFSDRTEGWETAYAYLVWEWEENLRDASWYPFKILRTEDGDFEEHIDKGDERLAKLYEDFGVDVYMTVVDALNELNEYNASGRVPISVPWNFEQGRAAKLEEILEYLANLAV